MKLKHLVLALGLVSVASMANATTTAVGSVTVGAPAAFSGFAPVGAFIDTFTFDLPTNGGSGYSVINFPVSIPGVGSFNSLLTTMTLFSDPDSDVIGDELPVFTVSQIGGADSLSKSWGELAAGSYFLLISGFTNGSLGGIYSGAISVTAVPEPETWALLAAGLGVVGLKLRRRSNTGRIIIN